MAYLRRTPPQGRFGFERTSLWSPSKHASRAARHQCESERARPIISIEAMTYLRRIFSTCWDSVRPIR
jgi:hypothetical protein